MCNHEPLTHPDGKYPDYVFSSQHTGTIKLVATRTNGQEETLDHFRVCKKCSCLYSEAVHLGLWRKPQEPA